MINFKNFLFERTERIELMSEDKVIDLLTSIYSKEELSDIFTGNYFYRGDRKEFDYGLCKPKLNKRVSPDTANNYYNIFLSNDETWKEYPSREYSIIGSTDLDMARKYGVNTFICIPLNKQANIGIAPEKDIWFSFRTLKKLKLGTLDDFFYSLQRHINSSNSITDYNTLKKELEKPEFLSNINKLEYHPLEKTFKKSKNAFKTIQELLNPEINNFKHISYNDFIHDTFDNQEVWTSDDVIMIDINHIENIKSRLGI